MKRWAKVLLAIAGLFVLAIVSIRLFVHANTFRPAIEKQLSATLGRKVKLGDLSLSVLSGSLVAEDLIVADDPNFSAEPFLTAKEFRIGVSMKPLIFAHQVNLRSFQIESPQITAIRAANGTWNFSSIGHFAPPGARAAAKDADSGTPENGALTVPNLSIGQILVEDGHLTIASLPAQGAPAVYEHVNLAAHSLSFGSQFPLELSADLPGGGRIGVIGKAGPVNREDVANSPVDVQISFMRLDPVASGILDPADGLSLLADIDAHVAADGETLTASGTMHIQNLKLRKGGVAAPKPLDVTFAGTQSLKDNTGRIEDVAVKIGDTALHANGTYKPAGGKTQSPLLKLELAGQNLPIDELRPLMAAAAMHLPNGAVLKGGTLLMNLVVAGRPESLAISGPIALDNTHMVGFDVGSKIHGIAALSGVKTGDTTDIEKLRVNVRVTNAGVVANNIDAVISGMGQLTGNGTVSADNQVDFNLLVRVASAKGMGKVGIGLLTTINGSGGLVPVRVTGTSDDPNITADVGGMFSKKTKSFSSIFGKKN